MRRFVCSCLRLEKSILAKKKEHIVFLDSKEIPEIVFRKLSSLGTIIRLNLNHPSQRQEVKNQLKDATVLWVALGQRIDEELLVYGAKIKDIVTVTTGLSHLDIDYIKDRGIRIHSLRGEQDFLEQLSATAEHTWALILGLQRKIFPSYQDVVKGHWRREGFKGHELFGRTIGIIGIGRLGRKVAGFAHAFGMNVLGYDTNPERIPDYVTITSSIESLIEKSDVVTLHIHATTTNHKLLSAKLLSHMNTDSLLVNTSRGELIDEGELVALLKNNKIAGYAADVVNNECSESKSPLQEYATSAPHNLILTPHLGGYTWESRKKSEIFMANKFLTFKLGRT
jgi:D-3-phosphoglycerate dehydrogenase / 2-oxoglutarate reductase